MKIKVSLSVATITGLFFLIFHLILTHLSFVFAPLLFVLSFQYMISPLYLIFELFGYETSAYAYLLGISLVYFLLGIVEGKLLLSRFRASFWKLIVLVCIAFAITFVVVTIICGFFVPAGFG